MLGVPQAARHRGAEVRQVRQQGVRTLTNDPSLPPDPTETVEVERIGDIIIVRVSWPMNLPSEKARVEGTICFPRRMLSRVVAAIHAAGG